MTDVSSAQSWPGKRIDAAPAQAWPGKKLDLATHPGEAAPKMVMKATHDRAPLPADPLHDRPPMAADQGVTGKLSFAPIGDKKFATRAVEGMADLADVGRRASKAAGGVVADYARAPFDAVQHAIQMIRGGEGLSSNPASVPNAAGQAGEALGAASFGVDAPLHLPGDVPVTPPKMEIKAPEAAPDRAAQAGQEAVAKAVGEWPGKPVEAPTRPPAPKAEDESAAIKSDDAETASLQAARREALDRLNPLQIETEKRARASAANDDGNNVQHMSDEEKALHRKITEIDNANERVEMKKAIREIQPMLPPGYRAVRNEYWESQPKDWEAMAGRALRGQVYVVDKDGAVIGNIEAGLRKMDMQAPWFQRLLASGEGKPAHEVALDAARNASGLPEGVTDLGAKRAMPALEDVAGQIDAATRKNPEGSVTAFPKPAGAAASSTGKILEANIAARDAAAAHAKAPGVKEGVKAISDAAKEFLAPQTLSKGGEAAASIRKFWGRSAREAERAKATMEDYRKLINGMDLQDRLDVLDYIQGFSKYAAKGSVPAPEIAPFLDSFRAIMKKYQSELEALPAHEKMQFQEDFATQMWEDPAKAATYFGTKEGSTGFTKGKTFESYAEGIRAGLIPRTTDPLAIAVLYAENAGRYIATEKVFEEAKDAGNVVWRTPGKQPEGWVALDGRKSFGFEKAYAPRHFATVYNRAISRKPEGVSGDILSAVHRVTNYSTALQLGLSGYHAINTVKESIVSGLATGIQDLKGGQFGRAFKNIGGAPLKPVTSLLRGRQMAKMYLRDIGDPKLRDIVERATDANFRVVGKGRAADDYRYAASNYWEAWKRGSLKTELLATGKDIKDRPIAGTAKAIAQGVGKTLDTATHALFAYYIPMVKSGAYYDALGSWLARNPGATAEEQHAMARKLADIVDDRFGEMNQDNIFWSKTAKMLAQSAVVSYSYEMGTLRSFGGAAADFAAAPVRAALKLAGKPAGEVWTDKMSYVVALAITTGLISAIDQKIRTGKDPESWRDLVAPQTGGKDASTGEPERAVNPGYESQLMTLFADPKQWAMNKKNSALETVGELWSGKDWSGTEIAEHRDSMTETLKKYLGTIFTEHLPIPAQSDIKKGSKISRTERFLGARPAGMRLTAPEEFQQMMDKRNRKEDRAKEFKDRRYKGTLQ